MRILIISPAGEEEGFSGEDAFTHDLLSETPSEIEYIHYHQALKEGMLEIDKRGNADYGILRRANQFPPDAGTLFLINRDGNFDLIFIHVMSARILGTTHIPVVLSDSSSNYCFLKDYCYLPEETIMEVYKKKESVFRRLHIFHPTSNPNIAKKLICWSEYARDIHVNLGANPDITEVIPPGLPIPTIEPKSDEKGFINILFVGMDFERKGGKWVVNAFKQLKPHFPELRLYIITKNPLLELASEPDITICSFIKRAELYRDLYQKADIFVLPAKAERFGLTLVEAASFGIPSVTTDVGPVNEIVNNEQTGFVCDPDSYHDFVEKLELLIANRELREEMGIKARHMFLRKYSINAMNRRLVDIFRELTAD
jgi:glycosyltransferase involved in cell wall biosynthesis